MGRSKFPGKPSKHVNRTRINVLCTPLDTTTVGDTNNVVTVEIDGSKKIDTASNEVIQSTKLAEVVLKIDKRRKKRNSLVNKRAAIKRNGLLSTKLVNQVSRRTRSGVTGRRSIRTFSTIRKVTKSKHALSPTKESNNLVGKFVLPSRSVHSSRVIKPNKRFINVEQNEARTFKKRVTKRLCVRTNEDKCKIDENKVSNDNSVKNDVEQSSHSKGKVVLRQARLQLHTQTLAETEGPFSCTGTNNLNIPGTVTCGVCGAIRFYRFIKQARKFNIYSCESCRKFIAKMIKRQSNVNSINVPTLVCQKGQGMCHVPPVVRSPHWKLFRCAYGARCSACWLKMCLRSFQIPVTLKNSLAQLLPKNMQTHDLTFSSSLPLLSWQATLENKPDTKDEKEMPQIRRRPVRLKTIKRDVKPILVKVSEIKRQKVDLKGPRVKHVCRSASIVLGQPIATFPVDLSKKNDEDKKELKVKDVTDDRDEVENEIKPILKNVIKSENLKRERISKTSSVVNLSENKSVSYMRKNIIDRKNSISIDFWENYDPDEIYRNGFGLMSSESFPMQAICFLCGSAGQETLLYCLICCEPYHPYCLEQIPSNLNESDEKFNWLCPRCTTCNACGQADRHKINCQKCHKAYHPTCIPMLKRDDRPTVCSNCLRCKSCGTNNITKFVGNLALCPTCFKLRNKGNFCPLCQKCYDENDTDIKMMECGKCKKWIHAKCESLADEQYQILSLLPESIEFLCTLCSTQSTPYWREIVHCELRASFNNVLRLLSKNRTARNMLKLSPYKNPTVNSRPLISVKRLQFRDDDINEVNENKEINLKANTRRSSLENQETKLESKSPVSPSMVDIKNKLNSNEYISLKDFNSGMEKALDGSDTVELLKIYRTILKKVFPWFDSSKSDDDDKNKLPESLILQPTLLDVKKPYEYEIKIDNNFKIDRFCALCKGTGDGLPHKEARLLYCGQNEWVHANCALWSSEVYEEIDGSLQNVHSALSRGRSIRCAHCKLKGASVGCCEKGCHETYHFSCAQLANCYFLHDKTVHCQSHKLDSKANLLTTPTDFDIRRSVYVEVDRKKKKYCKPDKVNYMVGSLSVTSLGKIIPVLSDDFEAIIPSGFTCSRLFWSTTEPWRLIPYNITTSILSSEIGSIYVDRNFTVDHSLLHCDVEKKLKEILTWQKDLSKEFDSDEEEPQNTADLLSPELTDAIFEDLPHDFLDVISVQDMLINYEEFLNMEINCNDAVSLNMNKDVEEVECDLKCRELKRSKSEVFNQNVEKLTKNRSHQRSCSLTWSCKLDNSLTPAMKKRKIASRDNNMFLQLLQVDGACDSSGSESESPMHETEDLWTYETSEEPVTCERCQCTYRTCASFKRHLETCDVMSTSDSDTEEQIVVENPVIVNVEAEPNVLAYESYSSYQASQNEIQSTILNTQTYVTSEATSELVADNVYYPNFQQFEHKSPMITQQSNDAGLSITQPTFTMAQTQNIEDPTTLTIGQTQPTFCINQQPICVSQSNLSSLISLDNSLNQNNPISINPITINHQPSMEMQQPVMQSIPFTSDVTPILNISPHNQITIDAKVLTPCSNIVNSVMTMPQNTWVKPVVKSVIAQKTIKPRGRPRSLAAKRTRVQTGGTIMMQHPNPGTSVILQHLPSANMMPTFVDAFQQQSGQNLQYLATITPQINSSIPQTQLVQLQADNNFLSLVPNIQPTMIIQQPRVMADQLIVDGNGSMVWATQPVQPVYYGFETIVQNTVMQSQQLLPTTMPGVLTTNSSYSATTQVFQTSKLEPVLDVSQGSYVLLNSGQLVNPHSIQMTPTISQTVPQNVSQLPVTQIAQHKAPTWEQLEADLLNQPKPSPLPTTTNNIHSITLPLAPFVSEQGIPTNIVTPTPKAPTSTQTRPMSRVLPMQTREQKKQPEDVKIDEKDVTQPYIKPKITILENAIVKQGHILLKKHETSNSQPLKIALPKEIKVSQILPKISPPVQIASLKPIKTDRIQDNKIKTKMQNIETRIHNTECRIQSMENRTQNTEIKILNAENRLQNTENNLQNGEIRIKSTEIRLKSTENRLHTTENRLHVTENRLDTTVNRLHTTENTLHTTEHRLHSTQSRLRTTENKLHTTENRLQKTEIRIDKTENRLHNTERKLQNTECRLQGTEIKLPENHVEPKLENVEKVPIAVKKILTPDAEKVEIVEKADCPEKSTDAKILPEKPVKSSQSSILYTVETRDGFRYSSTSIYELWSKVFDAVQAARADHNMPPLPAKSLDTINNLQLLGLKTNGLRYLLEQLPGATKCKKYKPNFHLNNAQDDSDDDLEVGSVSGAIRTVPYVRKKEPNDMFGWLASKHRKPETSLIDSELLPRRGSITNLPMAMRFRQLKLTSKFSVGVYRSGIHRRGLFSLRDIESGEMVIEYAGEVIRSILTDKREKYYNSKGIGCYMFRIDDNLVVDATMKGNAARFINHSCDPNCYSKVVEIHSHKHIIIFALRRIICGEELTYDYKFPFEEDKIPCTCGARRCRKFLN